MHVVKLESATYHEHVDVGACVMAVAETGYGLQTMRVLPEGSRIIVTQKPRVSCTKALSLLSCEQAILELAVTCVKCSVNSE